MAAKTSLKKLHLGCQDKYLKGYINVDLPPENQTVEKVRADVYADVRDLQYDPQTIDEVRSHHLLEHFSRQQALVLLARWHRWLKNGGQLVVETPDFEESAKKFLQSDNVAERFQLGRHIFGSQEAGWANHLDFWYEGKFRYVLSELGFANFRFEKFANNLEKKLPVVGKLLSGREASLKKISKLGFNILPNIICYAQKNITEVDYRSVIKKILNSYLVGREKKILDVWLSEINL